MKTYYTNYLILSREQKKENPKKLRGLNLNRNLIQFDLDLM